MAWYEGANLAIVSVAALGAGITAYATVRMMLMQRKQANADKPALDEIRVRRSANPQFGHEAIFKIEDRDLTVWRVKSVTCRPFWKRMLCKPGDYAQDAAGGIVGYQSTGWRRKITYDPPTHSTMFLVHYDCPEVVDLDFELVMRASPNETSRFPMRVRIRD